MLCPVFLKLARYADPRFQSTGMHKDLKVKWLVALLGDRCTLWQWRCQSRLRRKLVRRKHGVREAGEVKQRRGTCVDWRLDPSIHRSAHPDIIILEEKKTLE